MGHSERVTDRFSIWSGVCLNTKAGATRAAPHPARVEGNGARKRVPSWLMCAVRGTALAAKGRYRSGAVFSWVSLRSAQTTELALEFIFSRDYIVSRISEEI